MVTKYCKASIMVGSELFDFVLYCSAASKGASGIFIYKSGLSKPLK